MEKLIKTLGTKYLKQIGKPVNKFIFPRKKITYLQAVESILLEEDLKGNRKAILTVFRNNLDPNKNKPSKIRWKTFILEEVEHKACYDCNSIKHIKYFNPKQTYCIDCSNIRRSLWRKNNKDKVNASTSKYAAKKRNAIPKWYSELDEFILEEMYAQCKDLEKTTGIKYHVDHIIPLSKGGLHWHKIGKY